jgi:hypothetical protein
MVEDLIDELCTKQPLFGNKHKTLLKDHQFSLSVPECILTIVLSNLYGAPMNQIDHLANTEEADYHSETKI